MVISTEEQLKHVCSHSLHLRRLGIRTSHSIDESPNYAPGTLDSYEFPYGRSLSSHICHIKPEVTGLRSRSSLLSVNQSINQFLLWSAFPLGTLRLPCQSLLWDTWVLHQW